MADMQDQGAARRRSRQVLTLVDLVGFQEGSVVSREIAKAGGGSVTLFAFDGDQGLSEHSTPFDALVQLIDGEAEVTIAGESFRLKAGDAILMPANQPHALRALGRFKMLLTMLKS